MAPLFEPSTDLNGAMLRLLVAALAGGLIGVERERSQNKQHEAAFAGARTFPLMSLFGASLTLTSGGVGSAVVAGFVGVAALVVASYVLTASRRHPGTTTETAAFAAYWIGVMAGAGAPVLAGAVAVGTAVLLASKPRLEAFSRALTQEELSATLTLAVLAAVILPILPDTRLGPWGVWNPQKLWLVVVLVCGLSFLGFVAMRLLGASEGLYVSGLLGGIVSSTAATVSFATRSKQMAPHAVQLAVAAGLASVVMFLRVGLLAGITSRDVVLELAPFLSVVTIAATLSMALITRRSLSGGKAPTLTNPFQLATALKFGLLYGLVLLVVEFAKRQFGVWGLMLSAVLAGLTDVDAITLALAGTLPADQAAGGIALAALSNTAAKATYAMWLGESRFRRTILLILGAAFVGGVTAMLFVGPRPWVRQPSRSNALERTLWPSPTTSWRWPRAISRSRGLF